MKILIVLLIFANVGLASLNIHNGDIYLLPINALGVGFGIYGWYQATRY